MNVALVDYGVGNLHSLAKALGAGGAHVRIEADPAAASGADALVLPGVGAFAPAAARLEAAGDTLRDALDDGLPCLGICLGMQLLFGDSEEGPGRGLGVLPGRVRRLRARRVPHMGWNTVRPVPADGPGAGRGGRGADGTMRRTGTSSGPGAATDDRAPDPLFADAGAPVVYYANSFVVRPDDDRHVIAWTEYGEDRFPAAVRRGRTWGVQFHPEKSGVVGMRLIGNFLAAAGQVRR